MTDTIIANLLKKHGFQEHELPNAFIKNGHNYKATIWSAGWTTITRYTPKHLRYIDMVTYKTIEELEKYLKENHPL